MEIEKPMVLVEGRKTERQLGMKIEGLSRKRRNGTYSGREERREGTSSSY